MLGLPGRCVEVPHHYVICHIVAIIALGPPADTPMLRLRLMRNNRRRHDSCGWNLSLRTGWLNCGSGLRRLPMHGGRAEGHLLLDRRLGDVSRQRCMRTEVRQGNANQKEEAHCYCADEHALQS